MRDVWFLTKLESMQSTCRMDTNTPVLRNTRFPKPPGTVTCISSTGSDSEPRRYWCDVAGVRESLNELKAHFSPSQCSHYTWKSCTTHWQLSCWCSFLPCFKVDPLLSNSVSLMLCFLPLRVAEVCTLVWPRFIPNICQSFGGRNLVWASDVLHTWRISDFPFFYTNRQNQREVFKLANRL